MDTLYECFTHNLIDDRRKQIFNDLGIDDPMESYEESVGAIEEQIDEMSTLEFLMQLSFALELWEEVRRVAD